MMSDWPLYLLYVGTGSFVGIVNAIAGGGPILTLGVLTVTGTDPRIANLTSTVALSPGQMAAGCLLHRQLRHVCFGPPLLLGLIALAGGALGAGLLLITASAAFRSMVPWLVLFATALYAASAFPGVVAKVGAMVSRTTSTAMFATMSVYGGYFGGGNSFLILALLGLTGHDAKLSGEIKNVLVAVVNFGAVMIFVFSGAVDWSVAAALGVGGVFGSLAGTRLYGHLSPTGVRLVVIVGGLSLAGWMITS